MHGWPMSRYDVLPLLVIICDLKFCSNMYSSLDIGSEKDKKNHNFQILRPDSGTWLFSSTKNPQVYKNLPNILVKVCS